MSENSEGVSQPENLLSQPECDAILGSKIPFCIPRRKAVVPDALAVLGAWNNVGTMAHPPWNSSSQFSSHNQLIFSDTRAPSFAFNSLSSG